MDDPRIWITNGAAAWLEKTLKPEWEGFEWGSGLSTVWLAHRLKSLISCEHDRFWQKKVIQWTKDLKNVKLHFTTDLDVYAKLIDGYGLFDFVFIDGRNRVTCIQHCLPHVKPGGLVMLDNSDRWRYRPGTILMKSWERMDFHGEGWEGKIWTTSIWWRR